jgi:hypothetical protein
LRLIGGPFTRPGGQCSKPRVRDFFKFIVVVVVVVVVERCTPRALSMGGRGFGVVNGTAVRVRVIQVDDKRRDTRGIR